MQFDRTRSGAIAAADIAKCAKRRFVCEEKLRRGVRAISDIRRKDIFKGVQLGVVAEMLDGRGLALPTQFREFFLDELLEWVAEVHEIGFDRLAQPAIRRRETHDERVSIRRQFVPRGFGAALGVAAQTIGHDLDLGEHAAGVRLREYGLENWVHFVVAFSMRRLRDWIRDCLRDCPKGRSW